MKKFLATILVSLSILSTLFCIGLCAEENEYEVTLENEDNLTLETTPYNKENETLYLDTIKVILNERETIDSIYTGFQMTIKDENEELTMDDELHFRISNANEINDQMMLFHILDVEGKMTEQILFERDGTDILFQAKPSGYFFLTSVSERQEASAVQRVARAMANTAKKTQEFSYTGSVQSFTAPISTTYTLEVWGASGGKDKQHEAAGGRIMAGGKGGYSSGEVYLEKGQTIYIVVGGEGESYAFNNSGGGYNGGGAAGGDLSSGGGGGATHIAKTNYGELENYNSHQEDVYIVAGGGGGGGYFSTGGHGGGLTANDDSSGRATGGGYAFGVGQSRKTTDDGAGAGGGWRGGKVYVDFNDYGAGGGTGYIGGVENGVSTIGVQSGNGKATISWINEYQLKIEYLDVETDASIHDPHIELFTPGSSYSVDSPTIDGYLLVDTTQASLTGDMNDEVNLKVYYHKVPSPLKESYVDNKKVDGEYIENGKEITYKIAVENPFDRTLEYTLKDTIPANTELVSTDEKCNQKEKDLTWILELEPKSKETLSFTVKVNGEGKEISNTASLEVEHVKVASNTTYNYTPVNLVKTVMNTNDESIDKEMIQKDETITYNIQIKNIAKEEKTFTIIDEISEYLNITSISDSGNFKDNLITWNVTMPANSEKTLSVKATLKKDAKGTIHNLVTQKIDSTSIDSNTVDVSIFEVPIKVVRNSNSLDIDNQYVLKNSTITYGILLHNTSPYEKEFFVTDIISSNLEVVSISHDGTIDNNSVSWNVTVPANTTKELLVQAKVLKEGIYFENSADVSVDKISVTTNTTKNWSLVTPSKQVFDENNNIIDQSVLYSGQNREITYVIKVQNTSDLEKNFVVVDKLSSALTYVSSNEGEYNDHTVTWKLTMPAHSEKELTITARPIDEHAGEKITNDVIVYVDLLQAKSNVVTNFLDDSPETVQVKGTVHFDDQDNIDKKRPGSVTIRLYANGVEIRNQKVIKDKDGNMEFNFTDVKKYQKGKEIEYKIIEDSINEYTTTISSISTNTYKVVNKYTPGVKKVTKVTPTPAVTTTSIVNGVKAPNTGDTFSPAIPSIIASFAVLLGIFACVSLRRWR